MLRVSTCAPLSAELLLTHASKGPNSLPGHMWVSSWEVQWDVAASYVFSPNLGQIACFSCPRVDGWLMMHFVVPQWKHLKIQGEVSEIKGKIVARYVLVYVVLEAVSLLLGSSNKHLYSHSLLSLLLWLLWDIVHCFGEDLCSWLGGKMEVCWREFLVRSHLAAWTQSSIDLGSNRGSGF